jgi:L-ascorbate metabolism protein UlaG (beta-lactamase superfamily)
MAFQLTWYGHAAFGMCIDGTQVLLDPFFTDNPVAAEKADNTAVDFIIVSHGHGDHVGDAVAIAQRTGATVISNYEICNWLDGQGVANVHPQHIGGGYSHPFGYVKLTIAHHGSALPDGTCGGSPAGVLITTNAGEKVYFACDTGLFLSMKLYGEDGLDLAVLPIGDNFTMGPDDALKAVKLLAAKTVIPVHFDTWDLIAQDPRLWAARVEAETESKAVILAPGGVFAV